MKLTRIVFIGLIAASFAFSQNCKNAKDTDARNMAMLGIVSTAPCMNCHSDTTVTGQKIRWAQDGWLVSQHATSGLEISRNGGGCQVCHTDEGFRKRLAGLADGTYGIADQIKDSIAQSSPVGCFTCHMPHTKGNFDLRVADGTTVTTDFGTKYTKNGGNLCANCHRVRVHTNSIDLAPGQAPNFAGTNCTESTAVPSAANPSYTKHYYTCTDADSMIKALVLNGTYGWDTSAGAWLTKGNPSPNAHDSPVSDTIMGKSGAGFPGQTYTNGPMSGTTGKAAGATCPACHMPQTQTNNQNAGFTGIDVHMGGHAFANRYDSSGASLYITSKINPAGCQQSCHTDMQVRTVGNMNPLYTGIYPGVLAATQGGTTSGHLGFGVSYLHDPGVASTDVQWYQKMNDAVTKLATPPVGLTDKGNCTGYLITALNNAFPPAGTLKVTYSKSSGRCSVANGTGYIAAGTVLSDNQLNVLRAVWNLNIFYTGGAFGIHNTTYLLQLISDSCDAAANVATSGATTSCGITRP